MNLTTDSHEYKRLFGVAYRILGSAHDAEDAIQEGALRWQALSPADRELIREPLAWMTRVVSRICLDQLGSTRARRESYAGIWLPEPVPGSIGPDSSVGRSLDPADAITLDESVSMALLRAMESLTPGERVALILHDVFALPFAEIGEIVGRTPEACRQLASTARRNIRSGPRFQSDGDERKQAVLAFTQACVTGNLDALMSALDPKVVVRSDGGGRVNVARRPVVGAEEVARFVMGIIGVREAHGENMISRFEAINNHTGLVISIGDQVIAVVDFAVVAGLIAEIAIIMNPEKLTLWTTTLSP
ncbi:RNA polymerase sigma factor SigJ [Antrihabitans cavernicola]|uniref:Sigma-70 family RNA polymerase sigma factor n=1 Tax=Antrihabitans cavernicola TaxID=2495913 RepID=A0A5A7SCD8_9NOCA|nr:RNA polymerase sigma factor SigJ [Spelaeibacter cavernicola]KAA0022155.1 sigma-70 family RNA polymerase sigma factor [Spelaeibacter cavernicola]